MISLPRLFVVLGVCLLYLLLIGIYATSSLALYVLLLLAGIVFFLLTMFGPGRVLLVPGKVRRIQARGREAQAVVLEIRDTGITLNQSPYVRLRLRVEPPDLPPYEASLSAWVSRVAIPRPGDFITVRYDPERPQDVIPA